MYDKFGGYKLNKKQLSINTISNLIAFVISIGVNFFFTPYLIKVLGVQAYGFISLGNDFIQYLNIFIIAFSSMAGRFITIKFHEDNILEANQYYNTAFFTNIILAIIGVLLSTIFILNLEVFINVPSELVNDIKYFFILLFLAFFIGVATSVFNVSTFCTNRLELDGITKIIMSIIRVVLLILLFRLFKPSIAYMGVVVIILASITAAINIIFMRKLLPQFVIKVRDFRKKYVFILLTSGMWNALNQMSKILLDGLDILIANIFIGASAMGMLALAKTIPIMIQSLIGVLVSMFVPNFTIIYASKQKDDLIKELIFSMKVVSFVGSVCICGLIIYGRAFYQLWIPNQNISVIYTLAIITIGVSIFSTAISPIFNIFTVTNKLKVPSVVLFITGVLSTLTVFVLLKVTDMGIYAIAGVSTIYGAFRNMIFVPLYGAKILKIKRTTLYIPIFRFIVSILLNVILLNQFIIINNIESWIELVLYSILGLIIIMITNMIILFDKNDKLKIWRLFMKLLRQGE